MTAAFARHQAETAPAISAFGTPRSEPVRRCSAAMSHRQSPGRTMCAAAGPAGEGAVGQSGPGGVEGSAATAVAGGQSGIGALGASAIAVPTRRGPLSATPIPRASAAARRAPAGTSTRGTPRAAEPRPPGAPPTAVSTSPRTPQAQTSQARPPTTAKTRAPEPLTSTRRCGARSAATVQAGAGASPASTTPIAAMAAAVSTSRLAVMSFPLSLICKQTKANASKRVQRKGSTLGPGGAPMRWQQLFGDLSAQLDHAEADAERAEAASRARAEVAAVRLVDRLRGSEGRPGQLRCRGAGRLAGQLGDG